nr:MAG: capsid protein precursor [Mamastrovirus 3]
MANDKNNVQPKVVTTTTTTTRRRGGRRRRRTPRASAPGTTTVRKVTTTRQPGRAPRRRRNRFGNSRGAAPWGIRQRVTATLGTVGSNQGKEIELEMSALLNPALMKETTGSNQLGPLQIYASNYSLWKLDHLLLKLTPLVGSSAVSGTAVRASFNFSGQPGSPSWSALGARKHKDTNPGKQITFYLSGNDIKGPKDGWFYCNTKNDPKMCIAGSVEIHTLGKTMSTYKNEAFDGPLFLVELTGQWSFKNYNPQPGMMNLVKTEIKEQPQEIKIHSNPGEPILLSIPNDSRMARAILQTDIAATATPSEIIWQICDAAIGAATGAFPPPFNWLFKCGWWFVKRVANKNQNVNNVEGVPNPGELVFQVFQSINDAQNDVPCISTGTASTTNTTVNDMQLMQITPGNTGMQQETISGLRRTIGPTTNPVQVFSRSSLGQAMLYGHVYQNPPLNCVVAQAAQGQQKVYSYVVRELLEPVFMQDGNEVDPTEIDLPSYPIFKKVSNQFTKIGQVYAAKYARIGTSDPIHWTTVCWQATTTTNLRLQNQNNNLTDQFVFVSPRQSQAGSALPTTTYTVQITNRVSLQQLEIPIQEGRWYLSTFVAKGNRQEFSNYGTPFYLSQTLFDVTETPTEPTFDAIDAGAMVNTCTPLKLQLNVTNTPSVVTLSMVQDIIQQTLTQRGHQDPQFPPPPSEYENMPPLEGDEEEEPQGAAGGAELQQDIKNWVEFGHRKRPPTPFSPIEEEEEENDEESDLDDDDYAEPPSAIKDLLTPEAKNLYGHLRQKGLSHEQATNAAQAAFPHIALEAWDAAYHNAMADGLSPPTARDLAWAAVSDFLS